jgi:hypothetical protein
MKPGETMNIILTLMTLAFSLPAIAEINNKIPLDIALRQFCDSSTNGRDYTKRKAKRIIANCYANIESNPSPRFLEITIGSDGSNLLYGPCSAMDGSATVSDQDGNILGLTTVNYYCGPSLSSIRINLDGKTPLTRLYFDTSGDPNRIKAFHLY